VPSRTHATGLRTEVNPIVPTLDALNDVRSGQFARIRSVPAGRCDYGSGGRRFESLPARRRPTTSPWRAELVEVTLRVRGKLKHFAPKLATALTARRCPCFARIRDDSPSWREDTWCLGMVARWGLRSDPSRASSVSAAG